MAAFSHSLGGPGDLVLFGCFQGWVGGGGEGKLLGYEIHGALLQARWARLGVGSCHFICSADPTQSLEDVV